jgi:hypothetical protein
MRRAGSTQVRKIGQDNGESSAASPHSGPVHEELDGLWRLLLVGSLETYRLELYLCTGRASKARAMEPARRLRSYTSAQVQRRQNTFCWKRMLISSCSSVSL